MLEPRATARVEESLAEADQLRAEFDDWMARSKRIGALGQYQTQLTALAEVVRPALAQTRNWLADTPPGRPTGAVYDECRGTDRRVVLLRRFWRWYGDRFDQRLDPQRADLLLAADEMVWSCWSEIWRAAGADRPGAVPLPCLDTTYEASARARHEVPRELRAPRDEILKRWTGALPVPTIALPTVVLRRPWWLILVAHEVGHHVQDSLIEPDEGAARVVAPVVTTAAAASGANDEEQANWRLWATELFADAVAVVLAAGAVAWAVEEVDIRADRDLSRPPADDYAYAPPLVRWALLVEVARQVGVPAEIVSLRRADPATLTEVAALLARVPAVATALLGIGIGGSTLGRLGARTTVWQRQAVAWRTALLAFDEPASVRTTEAARLCVAGGVLAWRSLSHGSQVVNAAQAALRRRLPATVVACRVDGVRAAAPTCPQASAALTRAVIDDLFTLGENRTDLDGQALADRAGSR